MKKLIQLGILYVLLTPCASAQQLDLQLDSNINIKSCQYKHTGNTLDLAAINRGYFVVGRGAFNKPFYTRYGAFALDKDQILISKEDGNKLLGSNYADYPPNLSPIKIPTDILKPQATHNIEYQMNLSSQAAEKKEYSAASIIYDAIGATHVFVARFIKTQLNTWSVDFLIDEQTIATGVIQFNKDGTVTAESASHSIEWNSDTGLIPIAFDLSEITQYPGTFYISKIVQDGYESASLSSVHINEDGRIALLYSNGVSINLDKRVALATFKHPEHLTQLTNSLYSANGDSGEAEFQFYEVIGNFLVGYLEEKYCLPE